ncbi:MAG TPA: signal peptidase II [Acidimicrobiia bacterium]
MRRNYITAVSIAAGVVIADLLTKRYAAIHFTGGDVEVIPGFLSFTYTENPGAAFSSFQAGGPFLALAAVAVIGYLLFALRSDRPLLEVVGFGFVIGGAAGNLADRIWRAETFLDGTVIDWIDLWFIPTFNLADTAITVAVVLLIIDAWRRR